LVIDPEGEFATLREKFDYVLAARNHGDTVADPRSAALLAERLLELGVSAILDIYELKHHERIRFVRLFLEALVNARKELWHPVLVVVDEAHVFCPQQGEAESSGPVIDLQTRGRKRGFCGILATQRISKLHKDAAAECNNKLIGRSAQDVDMKRAADELGLVGREEVQKLRTLEPGDFFAFGPALSSIVTRVHVGDVKTTHLKAGARLAFTPPPPTAKVRALLPKLADLPAEAEERSKSLKEAHQEIANLKRELTVSKRAAPPVLKVETKVQRVEVPVLKDGQLARFEKAVGLLSTAGERVQLAAGVIGDLSRGIVQALQSMRNGHNKNAITMPLLSRPPIPRSEIRRVLSTRENEGVAESLDLGRAERAVLQVLAQFTDGCDKGKLALLSGYRWSGGFRNTLSTLRTAGLMEGDNTGVMRITQAGLAAGDWQPLPIGDDLREFWLKHPSFAAAERDVLKVLIAEYPSTLTGPELASVTNREYSGGFRNILSELRTAGVMDGKANQGPLRAHPTLFES
jgi:hypothetical protein